VDASAVELHCGTARVKLPAGALPRGIPLSVQEVPARPAEEGLLPAATAVRIEPAWRIPMKPASLRYHIDVERHRTERVGVYRWDPVRERWSHEGGTGEGARGEVEARLGELGIFRAFEDASAPEWGRLRPASGSTISSRQRRVRVELTDRGSGIDWEDVALELDGHLLESEYDPDRDRIDARLPRSLVPGKHRLRAVAADRAGNRSADLEWSFTLARSP
jgi:hypothetical protein